MEATNRVKEIFSWYGSDNPGTLTNLARIMNSGKLAGTGKFVILPVDQGLSTGRTGRLPPTRLLTIRSITSSLHWTQV